MPSIRYIVKTDVAETLEIIKQGQVGSNIVFSEIRTFEFGELASLACEKFYFRSSNRAALFVNIHNFNGETEITIISTGSSNGFLTGIDWGAALDYMHSVVADLKRVAIREVEINKKEDI
ncbi:DUF6054 family protein [Listeria ivanovii]|uniref:Uncharacterized protein n=1 Tax=Listeria ivanovii (strain ATCC BAA-678 / PAM 55) TaxID=881621 RepID=G2ZEW8_LISIP|nr:DUF6054 family protein [Listeria ivanovii]AHI55700.1 hypothetical protein AX25_06210 [Listeria ivanovii WSLC3009]AIS65151.1 hypothetical protein JL52_06105 [Listeria ivanovii subsp. ivanovii]MBC1758122.1 hypothetical protein [Listeria ivanovii]MBK3912998.1 hypothetical protein [Listeria ivanovii subsp. ivanovii]MBK3920885.1 hypothetical protein [Listeria ivanovii subsp. ivanovii]